MEYQWNITQLTDEQQALCLQLAQELNISPVSAGLLVRRSICSAEEAKRFIRPNLNELHDPFLMRDMDRAIERLLRAIDSNERILIYGDYDVDGTTAVALVYTFLHRHYDNIDFYIPDRYTEGYGISFKGIDYAQSTGCTLIIALDCGIKAIDKVQYASQRQIDFIICDHHNPGDELPEAVAVLDAKRADNTYPYTELSGCGVGFKLMQAFAEKQHIQKEELLELLPLLAMSIASDIVPITGENRILAHFGLQRINQKPSVGIHSIMQRAGIAGQHITISDLVFKIGPRINACGRMDSGAEAVRLLITDDEEYASHKAEDIDAYNNKRKDLDKSITLEALEMLRQDQDNDTRCSSVVYGESWHKGVVGIVASRLTETYYRPTIVFTGSENGLITGSARSVGGFDIYSAIDSCRDLLTNFGGHTFAAGLSLAEKDLGEFKRRFEEYVAAHIEPSQKQPTLNIEAEIQLGDIDRQFFKVLRCLEPFGPDNPRPIFVTRDLINNRNTRRVGKMGEHLKLDVTDRNVAISGIAFGKGDWALHLQNGNPVDICYTLEENTFNGVTSLQMMVEDIKKK